MKRRELKLFAPFIFPDVVATLNAVNVETEKYKRYDILNFTKSRILSYPYMALNRIHWRYYMYVSKEITNLLLIL